MATINNNNIRLLCTLALVLCCLPVLQAAPAQICGAGALGYDLTNLTSRVWTFEGNNSTCLPVNGTVPATCTFYMGLCQKIANCSNASVCQSSKSNLSSSYFNLGNYTEDPFHSYAVPPGFNTTFRLGELFNKSCPLKTHIFFECNSNSIWPSKTAAEGKVPVNPAIKFVKEQCLYNITFEYAGACVIILPSENVTQLSGGTVLLIIFTVTLIVYFTFGAMLNIARGRHGKDVIPHADFWMTLPVYVADGILFTCRCGKLETSSDYNQI
ncbi:hypothetical protein SNE40_012115 [Patella caerulea]|uniref:Autophagy-related protein 27 n=1 Tax=Patella caerulea TaxID=87958 RepID=A0AAN8JMX4_PATCE